MKQTKRMLAILLAVLMLVLTVPMAVAEEPSTTIQFGTYPQIKVTETDALKTAASTATWKSYKYYTGTGANGKMTANDNMKFTDFFCGGEKYRAVKFTQYRPNDTTLAAQEVNSEQTNNGYTVNTTYYFKYEPLTWLVLDDYIVCVNVIDAQAYQNTVNYDESSDTYLRAISSTDYANNYEKSSLREWLNYEFYETAFTADQQNKIQPSDLENTSLVDKVVLLSSDEANALNTRVAMGTDYAECQGLKAYPGATGAKTLWWTRTAGSTSGTVYYVNKDGYVSDGYFPWLTNVGVRPACKLSDKTDDTNVSTFLLSAGANAHIPGETVKENEVPATCKEAGSYDEVVYCTDCGVELSREKKTIDKIDHTPGEVVKENEVAPTCTEAGSYDDVTYCTECGDEASRVKVTVDALGHIDEANDGLCDRCGEKMTGEGHCGYCGQIHSDDFNGKLTGWGHTILNLFKTTKPEDAINTADEGVQDGTKLFQSFMKAGTDLAGEFSKAADSIQKTLIPLVLYFGKVFEKIQGLMPTAA